MKRLIVFLGLSLAFCAPLIGRASACDSYSLPKARSYILQSERQWLATQPDQLATVRRILADDFVWVDDGKVLDKAAALKDAAAGPGDIVVERLDSANVRFFGDTAIVQGASTWVRKNGHRGHEVFTDTWVLRAGQWQIVASEDITIAR